MSISKRIHDTIEEWQEEWRERLRGWLANVLGLGIETFADVVGKAAAPKLSPLIASLEATGKVPPELQPLLDEIKKPTGEIGAFFAQSAGGALVGGAVGKILDGILLPLAYAVNSVTNNVILNEQQYMTLWLRGVIDDKELTAKLKWIGLSDAEIPQLKELSQVRLNPEAVARLWVRDKAAYNHLWQDLKDSGVSDDRIQAFKELAYLMPTYQDVVNFMAHEVFEEDAVTKYGLDNEFDKLDLTWFDRVGVRPELAKQLWRNHWQHPAFREITEMLHRGEITDADVYDWYRLVEIPPHWRDKLTAISWDLPNRIELRMMARFGLVDKAFLVEQLKNVGLREDFRDIAADMMLVMGIRTDLSTRYSKGWLDAEGVKSEIAAAGLGKDIGERLYQWIVKNVSNERVVKERDLTLTDIYKGIKKGTLTRPQGRELIKAMGYDDFEVEVKLSNNVPLEETVVEVRLRQLTKADILKAYKLDEFDRPETIMRLVEIRYLPADADILANLVDRTRTIEPDEKARELTKIDIIKAVKAAVLTPEEGYAMLQDVGYTPKDAEIIFQTRIEAEAGSPNTFGEFNNMVQTYRASQGQSYKETPEVLIQAERDVKATQAALDSAKALKVKPKRMAELERAVEDAKIAYHQLLSSPETKS